jgi:hypothetical protein
MPDLTSPSSNARGTPHAKKPGMAIVAPSLIPAKADSILFTVLSIALLSAVNNEFG